MDTLIESVVNLVYGFMYSTHFSISSTFLDTLMQEKSCLKNNWEFFYIHVLQDLLSAMLESAFNVPMELYLSI